MCAIAGFCEPCYFNFKKNEGEWLQILNSMNRAQRHRGPDDFGIKLTQNCGLAHARLSIVDLKNGKQPMTKTFKNKTLTIVYNGEIYNTSELRAELKKKGIEFQTNCDTEVVLNGHLVYGSNFVKQLNGIFAYAIWNESDKTLFLFRDRFGIKPLFYTKIDNVLVFSSEIKGLMCYPNFKNEVDKQGLSEIFGIGPARTPGNGIFKNVFEVKPGQYLKFNEQGLVNEKYWELKSKPHTDSIEETIEKTRFLVVDSIKKQMVSDVSLCSFLSGGVDSSIVTAICANEFAKKGLKLNTFSFDFVGNEKFFKSNSFQPSQDKPWVEKMVNFSKTNHAFLKCDTKTLVKNLFTAVDATDLPCMADVEASLLHFCSKVALKNKVVLTGECADEIFGGYPWFYKPEMFEAKTFPWSTNLNVRQLLLKNSVLKELNLELYVEKTYNDAIKSVPKLDGENQIEARRRELSFLNLKWFMQTLLNRMDRASMFYGLEARVPFADYRIVEYVFNVPWEIKCHKGLIKGLLRSSAEPFLPNEILYRKKSPYPKTYNPEFENMLKKLILEKMSNSNSPIKNLISQKKLEKFLNTQTNYTNPWFGQLMAGPQLLGYLLQINYWLEKFKIKIV